MSSNNPINRYDQQTSNNTNINNNNTTQQVIHNDPIVADDNSSVPPEYLPPESTIAAARESLTRPINTQTAGSRNVSAANTPTSYNRRAGSIAAYRNPSLNRVINTDNNSNRNRSRSVSEFVRNAFDFDDSAENALRRKMREGMSSYGSQSPSSRNFHHHLQQHNVTLPTVSNTPTLDNSGNVTPRVMQQQQGSADSNIPRDTAYSAPGDRPINIDHSITYDKDDIATDADIHDQSLPPYGYWQWIRPAEAPVSGQSICKWYCNLIIMASAVVSWSACLTFFMGNLLEIVSGDTLDATIYWDHINITGLGSFFGAYAFSNPVLNWHTCYATGITIMTTTAIAFPCFTVFIILELIRFTGIESPHKLVKIEFALYVVGAFCFIGGVCAFGGCVSQINTSVTKLFGLAYHVGWPIYGYMIGAAAFLLLGAIHAAVVLRFHQLQTLYETDIIYSNGEAASTLDNAKSIQTGSNVYNNNNTTRTRRLTMTGAIADQKVPFDIRQEIDRYTQEEQTRQRERQRQDIPVSV